MKLSEKQIQILKVVKMRNSSGKHLDIDQVLSKLPYTTTKQSFQFSIRILINKGLVEKLPLETRRKKNRVSYRLTKEGNIELGRILIPLIELSDEEFEEEMEV